MGSTTINAHMRKIARFNLLLFFSFLSSPLPICLPLALLFLSHTLFLPPLGKDYIRIYTPDSLLSCIIRLILKFLSSSALVPLSIFFISFPKIFVPPSFAFVLLFSFLPPFPLFLLFFPFRFAFLPFFFTLWFSSLALRAFDSFPPPLWGGGNYRRIYTPGQIAYYTGLRLTICNVFQRDTHNTHSIGLVSGMVLFNEILSLTNWLKP